MWRYEEWRAEDWNEAEAGEKYLVVGIIYTGNMVEIGSG